MSRPKGIPNNVINTLEPTSLLSVEERIIFLATLIVDKIQEDQIKGSPQLKKMRVAQ
jgi:hypothetical protein